MCERQSELNVCLHELDCGTKVLDCGVNATGGLAAGLDFARICMAGKADVRVANGDRSIWRGTWIQVETDFPVAACMMGQYAGWPVKTTIDGDEKFFAMGSGPMRVRRGKEELLLSLAASDADEIAVGTLECDSLPTSGLAVEMAAECGVDPKALCLAVAPTRSVAGCVQVVARSVETSLHKLHELGFPLEQLQSAYGVAPLCPPTPDFAKGIGRTNDAILYGAHVSLWIDAKDSGDDARLAEVGAKLPSSASGDFGEPFAEIFKRYEYDFYKVDPGLFSPAEVLLLNMRTGNSWCFGEPRADLIAKSFQTQ